MTPVTGLLGPTTVNLTTARGINGSTYRPVGATTAFPANTRAVYAIASFQNKPKGKSITFVWRYPNGKRFIYNNPYVAAYTDTTGYAELIPQGPGTYSVSVSISGHTLATVPFMVGGGPARSVGGGQAATAASPASPPVAAPEHGKGHANHGKAKHGKAKHGHD